MIGVLSGDAGREAVSEFFELFKTPWEYYRAESSYDVILCCGTHFTNSSANLVLIYSSQQQPFDQANGVELRSQRSGGFVVADRERIPIYGTHAILAGRGAPALLDEPTGEAAALIINSGNQTFLRVGYNLFDEIRYSLTHGQPSINSAIPTVELHIAFLRNVIISHSAYLVEIPPTPVGFPFIVCLTHDVDHLAIRKHKFDHAIFGFLYRGLVGSLVDFCRGKRSIKHVVTNWAAALSLPLVYLGVAKDTWDQFERYIEIESGLTSTFFFIPAKSDPGEDGYGLKLAKRAAAYDLSEVKPLLLRLLEEYREVGLHGIDAWRDCDKARAELDRIRLATGASDVGVRMHWLFFNEQSPPILDGAGFSYDSTVGYNDTVGYRAGTTQAFKFFNTERMVEIPLHIMDTALFFPRHMNLSFEEADAAIAPLVENVQRFGGVLTVNWHDRSIAPERLWGKTYIKLVESLKGRGAWFSTAMHTVAWFRQRRAAAIETVTREGDTLRVKVSVPEADCTIPGLRLRVHRGKGIARSLDGSTDLGYTDIPFDSSRELLVAV